MIHLYVADDDRSGGVKDFVDVEIKVLRSVTMNCINTLQAIAIVARGRTPDTNMKLLHALNLL